MHHLAALQLYRRLTRAEFCSNLFIEQANYNKPHYFALARRQRSVTPTQLRYLGILVPSNTVES
jgi:hypothetical protein